jgi:hypothetical protein
MQVSNGQIGSDGREWNSLSFRVAMQGEQEYPVVDR